ncbi:hypothetical protein K488DRAFT_68487 [Vararia minispora EC-137]|uniref:Uncharacterized protein n=1 Tax=Vararia minispora EC-137 TaxID=1314806 RepID=A0ACB8QUH8_9AGAM|nr:hypothetical protein K488DRAFT_68487 [Vararia minispora EC-137]
MSAPTSSPSSTRVSARRGSVSASDPYGKHLELNMSPSRSTSSKLSIVRVISLPPIQLEQPPASPHRRHHFGPAHASHRRHGSGSNGAKPDSPRLSFASSSFAAPGSPTLSSSSRPGSPTHHRHSSASIPASRPRLTPEQLVALAHESSSPRSGLLTSPTLSAPVTFLPAGTAPANFTELADDVFLPFVNRAEEVAILFSAPPCSKLLTLLSQTFAGSPLSSPVIGGVPHDAVFDIDPRYWSAPQLSYWLKSVDRDRAPDDVWVARARACVLEHSELIWQRIKGALGVPPELDIELLGDVDVMASLPSAVSIAASTDSGPAGLTDQIMTGSLSPELPARLPSSMQASTPEQLTAGQPPSEQSDDADADVEPYDPYGPPSPLNLHIEPIYAGTSPNPTHGLPPTRPGAHSLADCVEEEEEEASESTAPIPAALPADVRGIRIRTAPESPSIFAGISPPPGAFAAGTDASPAVSNIALPPPVAADFGSFGRARSGSAASGRSVGGRSSRRYSYGSVGSSEGAYNPVGERGPGNPLFPSSFARLALGPTLLANNPSLRSPAMPPANRFGSPHAIRGRRGAPGSWVEGFDTGSGRYEYAVTVASESSGRSFIGAPA